MLNIGLFIVGLVLLMLLYALVTRFAFPRVETAREQNPAELVGTIIQVEVLNGCGVAGVAEKGMRYLRSEGFDVVSTGNHTSFDVTQTQVLDRVGNTAAAEAVAQSLGIPPERVREALDTNSYLDVSVIIGNDYTTLPFSIETTQ